MTDRTQLSEPMNATDVFHFADDAADFNDLAHEGDFTYWYTSDLATSLGYRSAQGLRRAVARAMAACAAMGISLVENVAQHADDAARGPDEYRLSRFGCYLVTMNADPRKPEVARAQAYFAVVAEAFRRYIDDAEDVERIVDRDELAREERGLNSAARQAGVTDYGLFQNAGYRGLYNMNLRRLRAERGVPERRSPLDYMGSEELAANRFRVTQTRAKLHEEQVQGQRAAERTAEAVGRKVRQTMLELSGHSPESLPVYEDIKKVRSAVKASQRDFAKIDR